MSCHSTSCNTITSPGCGVDLCSTTKLSTNSVIYTGPTLACSGISSCDTLTDALQKLDFRLCNLPSFTLTANNGITKTLNNFQLGGPLVQQTVIGTTAANSLVITGLVQQSSPQFIVSQDNSGIITKTSFSTISSTILGSLIFNNGLTKTGNTIQLGGTLIKPTTITTSATNTISLAGLVADPTPAYVLTESTSGKVVKTLASSIIPVPTPPTTADNGLNMSTVSNVQLGGPLIKNTTVDLDTFDLSLLDVTTDTGVIIKPGAANPTNYNIDTTKIRGKLNVNKFSHFEDNVGIGIPAATTTGTDGGTRLNLLKISNLGSSSTSNYFGFNPILAIRNPPGSTDPTPSIYSAIGSTLDVGFTSAQALNTANKYASIVGGINYGAQDAVTGQALCAFDTSFSFGKTVGLSGNLEKAIAYRVSHPLSNALTNWPNTITDFVGLQIDNVRTQMNGGINGTITNPWGIRQEGFLDRNTFKGNTGIGVEPYMAVDIAGDGNNAKLAVGRLTDFRSASQTTSIDAATELTINNPEDPNIISAITSRLVINGKPGTTTLATPLMGGVIGYPQLLLQTGENIDNSAGSPISAVMGRVYLTRVTGSSPGGDVSKIAAIRAHSPTNDAVKGYGGTIANAYGVYIDDQRDQMNGLNPSVTGTITNSYGIYQEGTNDRNIFNAEYNVFPNVIPLNYANDAAAAVGGVPLGGLYHTAGTLKIRIV